MLPFSTHANEETIADFMGTFDTLHVLNAIFWDADWHHTLVIWTESTIHNVAFWTLGVNDTAEQPYLFSRQNLHTIGELSPGMAFALKVAPTHYLWPVGGLTYTDDTGTEQRLYITENLETDANCLCFVRFELLPYEDSANATWVSFAGWEWKTDYIEPCPDCGERHFTGIDFRIGTTDGGYPLYQPFLHIRDVDQLGYVEHYRIPLSQWVAALDAVHDVFYDEQAHNDWPLNPQFILWTDEPVSDFVFAPIYLDDYYGEPGRMAFIVQEPIFTLDELRPGEVVVMSVRFYHYLIPRGSIMFTDAHGVRHRYFIVDNSVRGGCWPHWWLSPHTTEHWALWID